MYQDHGIALKGWIRSEQNKLCEESILSKIAKF